MPEPLLDFKVEGAKQLGELSKKLKDPMQRDLRLELRRRITAETKPVVADLRQAVMAIDSKVDSAGRIGSSSGAASRAMHAGSRRIESRRSHGLRATIARAIQVKIRTSAASPGVKITVDLSKMPEEQRKLPRALDSIKGWRHPVWGHTATWVTQHGAPWWSKTIEVHRDSVRAAIIEAMRAVANKIRQ
jgi:hypothetical protein